MNLTPNINLKLPEGKELYTITAANYNNTVIDTEIKALKDTTENMTFEETSRQNAEVSRVAAENERNAEHDAMIASGYIDPKSPVANFVAIASTYPTPESGWTVKTLDDGKLYRYNGTAWVWIDTVTASSYDALLAEVEAIQRSTSADLYASIYSFLATAERGKLGGTLKGMTLNNAVANGDFSGGTTGWTGSGAILSVSNKVLSALGSGSQAYTYVNHESTIKWKIGDKYYTSVRFRVTNISCTSLVLNNRDSVSGSINSFTISNPVANQWYTAILITTSATQTNSIVIRLAANYADSATANGKVMEVDGNSGVFAIDMTALGLEALTADQMKDLCDNGYFEGLKGSDVEVQTVGKNLANLNPSLWELGTVTGTSTDFGKTWAQAKVASTIRLRPVNPIKINKNNTYIMSWDSSLYYLYSMGLVDGRIVSEPTGVGFDLASPSVTITGLTEIAPIFRRVDIGVMTPSEAPNIKLQLELGSTATAYEPFKQSTLSIDKVLNRVPNGVADTYALDTGVFTQNVSDVYTLVAVDFIGLYTALANIDYIQVSYGNLVGIEQITDTVGTRIYTTVTTPRNGGSEDSATNAWKHASASTNIKIYVPKGTYANLAAAQTALAGTKILYQLATPVTTLIPNSLQSNPSGTVYINNNKQDTQKYASGITLPASLQKSPILRLNKVTKFVVSDTEEITETDIAISTCTVAGNGLSFTSTALVNGDYVTYNYTHTGGPNPVSSYSWPTNLKAQVEDAQGQLLEISKQIAELNDFAIAMLLNHEARLTAHSI